MESDSAERRGHGCLLLFSTQSLSAWQCPTGGGLIGKLNDADCFSRHCVTERRQAQNPENCCRGPGNTGRSAGTTLVFWGSLSFRVNRRARFIAATVWITHIDTADYADEQNHPAIRRGRFTVP